MLPHHPTGWRKLRIQIFDGDSKQEIAFSVEYARNTKLDFIFLQETLVSKFESIRDFQSRWSGPSFWSPALGKQGGVAIFVQENSRFDILNRQKDSSGTIVSLLVKVDDACFNLVKIYAPTNPTERKEFFENLHEYFYPHCYQIIAGISNHALFNRCVETKTQMSCTMYMV